VPVVGLAFKGSWVRNNQVGLAVSCQF